MDAADVASLPNKLRNPLKYLFRSMLFVAEGKGQVQGFAFLSMEPQLHFAYLDYLSAAQHKTSRGIGGALYAHVRQEAKALGAVGLFYECLPDDPALSPDPDGARRQQGPSQILRKLRRPPHHRHRL